MCFRSNYFRPLLLQEPRRFFLYMQHLLYVKIFFFLVTAIMTKMSNITFRKFYDTSSPCDVSNDRFVTSTYFTWPFVLRCSCSVWDLRDRPVCSWVLNGNAKFPKTLNNSERSSQCRLTLQNGLWTPCSVFWSCNTFS